MKTLIRTIDAIDDGLRLACEATLLGVVCAATLAYDAIRYVLALDV